MVVPEFLQDKGYVVHGIKRRASTMPTWSHLYQDPHEEDPRLVLLRRPDR